MTLPQIDIHVLGGTITMAAGAHGATPSLDGNALLAAVPALEGLARYRIETPFLKPSASQTFADITMLVERLQDTAQVTGHVIVQGTDTIDETGFLLDLLYRGAAPVVITGAMRTATAVSADGPGNILAAVQTALSPLMQGQGVVVTINDTIHAAHRVEKTHKGLLDAFTSPQGGALGHVLEGRVRLLNRPMQRTMPNMQARFAKVAIIKAGLDVDTDILQAIPELGYAGVVIEATGAGHVAADWADVLKTLVRSMPVVLASRVMRGPIFSRTYGFQGSEMDLLEAGLISAHYLSSHKARLLLSVAIGNQIPRTELPQLFAAFA